MITLRLVCFALIVALGSAAAQPKKPKLPPGLDPGGQAIVLLTTGIDYTKPELASRLARDDVVLTLVKDGDHRLSRPEDIERLIAAVAEF